MKNHRIVRWIFIDADLTLHRRDVVKEATSYARRNRLPLPTKKDVVCLNNLYDYYLLYNEIDECTRKEYDKMMESLPDCASFPSDYSYVERM